MEKSFKRRLESMLPRTTLKNIEKYTVHSSTQTSLIGISDLVGTFVPPSKKAVTVVDSMLDGLNGDQITLVNSLADYINTASEIPFFTVQGGGGTGKSYSIYRILSALDPDTVIAATPSHAAKNVLQEFLGLNFKVKTIASLLGKKISYDSSGKQVLIPNRKISEPPIVSAKVVVIDECSMVNDDTAAEIILYCSAIGAKLIVMGDYAQLPPVGQHNDSLFFEAIGVELKETMRFKGDILRLTNFIRDSIDTIRMDGIVSKDVINRATDRVSSIDIHGNGYVFYKDTKRFLMSALDKFKLGNDKSFVRIIAFRNTTIARLNQSIRLGLYGEGAAEYEKGEILINNGGYVEKDSIIDENGKIRDILRNRVYNGSVLVVNKVVSRELEVNGVIFNTYSLYFDGRKQPVPVVAESSLEKYEQMRENLSKRAKNRSIKWSKVEDFENTFAKFDYAYAVNTHKVQGNTIRHVYILESDILDVRPTTVKEKLQALYVSVSRASFRVYVGNENYMPNNSKIDLASFSLV